MTRSHIAAALAGCFILAAMPAHAQPSPETQARLDRAWRALGLPDGPPAARTVEAEIAGEAWMLEQSGDLEGGWIRLEQTASVRLDLLSDAGEVTENRTIPAWDRTPYGQFQIRFDGTAAAAHWPTADGAGRWTPAPSSQLRAARRYRDLFPESLLIEAAAATDLRLDTDGDLLFTRRTASADEAMELHLDAGSGAPVGFTLTTRFPDDIFLSMWGETEIVGTYGFWWRSPGGDTRPRQLDLTLDGRPWQRFELQDFTLDPADAPGALTVPDVGANGPAVRTIDDFPFSTRHESPAAGVQVYYGAWHVMAVELSDGVYVFDAPISDGYSRAVMDQIATDFPGRPVRAVISTSNAWPHMAGIGAYVEAGVPVYLHPDNLPLVRGVLGARALGADLRVVSDGDRPVAGTDAVVLHLARGPALHGMMFASLPEAGLVWASDALQLNRGSTTAQPHARQYVAEFLDSVCNVDPAARALAMHQEPVTISALAAEFASDPVPPCSG